MGDITTDNAWLSGVKKKKSSSFTVNRVNQEGGARATLHEREGTRGEGYTQSIGKITEDKVARGRVDGQSSNLLRLPFYSGFYQPKKKPGNWGMGTHGARKR